MKNTIKNILDIILTLAIISSMMVGVYAFVTTPTSTDLEVREVANSIKEMERKSISDYDPTTFEVIWVSKDYSNCLVKVPDGNIHSWTIYQAYDNVVVLDINGELNEFYYTR